jgi:hypothetical protein
MSQSPTTGYFRSLLLHFSPAWVVRRYGEGLTQGMVGLLGDLLAESASAALVAPLLADEDSPPDAVIKKSAERNIDRYPTDTTTTHRARTIDAWNIWEGAGTVAAIANQIVLFGYEYVEVLREMVNVEEFPRRFFVAVSTEGMIGPLPAPEDLVVAIFRIANKFRAGEERLGDVTVLSSGRTFDVHPLTGLPHTFDDPGPGIDTFGSSVGVSYREVISA